MPRVKRGVTVRARHKKVISAARGFHGRRNNVYRTAKRAVARAGQYAYRGRHNKKCVFRVFWIVRINVGVCEHGLTYSKFMSGLEEAFIELDRKALSDMTTHDKVAFAAIVNQVEANVA